MKITERVFVMAVIGLSLSTSVFCGPFEDGCKAYDRKDWPSAMLLLKPFAERGNARAQFYVGYMSDMGYGVSKSPADAFSWYQKSARQGFRGAQNNLGGLYEDGAGVKKDERIALEWYRKAAQQHYATAERNIARFYRYGTVVKKDPDEAIKWYKLAASHGDPSSQCLVAKEALEEDGLIPKDYPAALAWLRKAESQDSVDAKCCLGLVYELGLGVPKDSLRAFEYYKSAASAGSINAEYHLGTLYERGIGISQDYSKAIEMYSKAADVGHPHSQLTLARLLSKGPDSARDIISAYKWLRLAEEFGLSIPEKVSQDIVSTLSKDQVAEADRLVALWRQKHPQDEWPDMPADPHVSGSSWGEVIEPSDGRLATESMSITLLQTANLDKSFGFYYFRDYTMIYLSLNSADDETPVRFHCPERVATLAGLASWPVGCKLGIVSYSTNSKERTVTAVLPYSLDLTNRFSVGERTFRGLLGWRITKNAGKVRMNSPVAPSYFLISEISFSEEGQLSIGLGSQQLTSPVEVAVDGSEERIKVFRGDIGGAAVFIVKPLNTPTSRVYKAYLVTLCAPANELDFYVDLMSYWLGANLVKSGPNH